MREDNKDNQSSYKDYSASINLAVIDTVLGTTVSGSTNLPLELYERPEEERDTKASQLIIDKNELTKEMGALLPDAVHKILEKPDASEQVKSGNIVIVMNSNLYGTALAGDVHQPNIEFNQQWNQIKNDIDIDSLKTEMEEAIRLMQESANEGLHYEDIANLSFARDELKKADGPAMLKHLRKLGEFGFSVIKGMGASILAGILLA